MGRGDGLAVSDDPVVRLLEVMARTLRDWPPDAGAPEEWDASRYLPGGDRYIPKLVIYGTPISPVPFLPIRSAEEIAAGERREAAGKVLTVLREAAPRSRPGRVRRLKAKPCPAAGRLSSGDEAPAAMISDRAREGRASAVLPAGIESRPSASFARQSCAACALGEVPRLLPLGFPLDAAGSMSGRRVYRSASLAGTSNSWFSSLTSMPISVNVFGCPPV
jgi:hypothetical protein